MKKMAKIIGRTRARTPRQKKAVRSPNPNSVTRPLDSWAPEFQPEPEKPPTTDRRSRARSRLRKEPEQVPEIQTEVPEIQTEADRKKMKERRTGITIVVSREEREIIRAFIRSNNFELSRWGREVLFREMGKEIPSRY